MAQGTLVSRSRDKTPSAGVQEVLLAALMWPVLLSRFFSRDTSSEDRLRAPSREEEQHMEVCVSASLLPEEEALALRLQSTKHPSSLWRMHRPSISAEEEACRRLGVVVTALPAP